MKYTQYQLQLVEKYRKALKAMEDFQTENDFSATYQGKTAYIWRNLRAEYADASKRLVKHHISLEFANNG